MCFYRTKLYKTCGHTEFRQFICNPAPISNKADRPDHNSSGQVCLKGRFACGEQPQHLHDLELGLCGHCRKTRYRNKGAERRGAVLEKQQSHENATIQRSLPDACVHDPKQGVEIRSFLPESDAKHPQRDEKTEDVDVVPDDALDEWRLFKGGIKEMRKECRQIRGEYQAAQNQISTMIKALNDPSQYRPVAISTKTELPAISIEGEHQTKPDHTKQAATRPFPSDASRRPLSHSATKVRRDLNAAKGRVRSMIQAINGKSDVSLMINPVKNKRMATSIVNTINRQSESQQPAKQRPPVPPKKELSKRPLPPPPCSDPRALSKPAKLELLTHHSYHRLPPIPEESASRALVVANSVPNTIVLRRAKAIKIRNLNAFHCPVRQPRFGLKRTVLAPPVPRHSTPPVAVPCSKFVDLGRRRVSEMEWCFVI